MSTSAQVDPRQPTTSSIDQLCINTIRTLVHGRGPTRPTPAIRARPWRWRRWFTACGSSFCDSIRTIRSGRIATASCCRPATPRCCCTRMLHLCQVKAVDPEYETLGKLSVTLDDIKNFRQLDSKCPGHPEYRWTSGVETTTGPLGQGVATSVGMAMASRWMARVFQSSRLRDGRTSTSTRWPATAA